MSLVFSMILFFAHAETTVPPTGLSEREELEARISAVFQRIQRLNADVSCAKKTDCVAVGVGNKTCGGPEDYAAVSKRNRDYNAIISEAQNHRTLREQFNQQYGQGIIGTCSMAPVPTLACQQNRCIKVATPQD